MTGLVTAEMRAALKARLPVALLCEIDHPDGVVNVWSRAGTLSYDGKSWTGLGALGRVGQVGSSVEFGIRQIVFELRGVPVQATEFLSSNVRGHTADLWIACIKPNRRVVPDPLLIANALLDYQTLSVPTDGRVTIQLIGVVGLYELDRAQNLAWSHEQQKRSYPTDTGLSLIPSLTNKEVQWRLP